MGVMFQTYVLTKWLWVAMIGLGCGFWDYEK
jgi:hypothetical protein